ncbi:C6 zinc finger domain-containing protein [Penicillium sp. IBT 18751x]|nr:C6 zinc finger domain-containing protein [Penicillium sp. IBT 18751x]
MVWSGLCNLYGHVDELIASKDSALETSTIAPQSSGVEVANPLPPLDRHKDILSMAHRVSKSVEFFLRDDMLLAGPLSIAPALGIVIDALKNQQNYASEIAWLQEALGVL